MNIPNLLTLLRLLLIPTFVLGFYLPWYFAHMFVAIIFILAAITDALDGYLARNLNQITKFGTFLDPVVDKLMVVIALVLVVSEMNAVYITLPAVVIIGREIIVSALREWMAELGKRTSVAVSFIGKVKTAVQMCAVVLLLLYTPNISGGVILKIVGVVLLYGAALLTLWSMIMYIKVAWPDLTFSKDSG